MKSSTLLASIGIVIIAIIIGFQSSLRLRVAVELLGWKGFFRVVRDTAADRTLGTRQTASRTAYHRLLDTLSDVDIGYCHPQRRVQTELDITECHRLITHLLSTGFRLFYETDLETPHFEHMVGPRMKMLGDNPDAFYYGTVINKQNDYVVRGRIVREKYFSLTIYSAPCVGCFSQQVIADINNRQLILDKDGKYEIVVSMKKKPENDKRNWLQMSNLTDFPQLITRHYYEDESYAQLNPNIRHELSIENLNSKKDLTGLRLTDEESAERFQRVIRFVRSHSLEMLQDPAKAPKWFSFTPNVFGEAILFRDEVQGLGAVDIVYSAGPFRFENVDTEGLLITGVLTKCAFANIVLWNRLLQTLSYESGRPVSLNRKQMKSLKGGDLLTGEYTILLSKRLPKNGLPKNVDWLDTEGREDGTMFWRFLLPEETVQTPRAKLIQIDSLS